MPPCFDKDAQEINLFTEGSDPPIPEATYYFEIVEAFFAVSKVVTYMLIHCCPVKSGRHAHNAMILNAVLAI
jgi:hypothetical protein